MASSSHQTHRSQNPLEGVSGELEKQERGRNWPELGLGLGLGFSKKPANEQSYPVSVSAVSDSSCPPFPFHHQHHQWYHHQRQIELGLGLGLEARARAKPNVVFDYRVVRCKNGEPSSKNPSTLWQHQDQDQDEDQDQDQDQDHNYDNGMSLLPWQMKSRNQINWQMQMFSNSNDYRRPHHSFWFILISSTNRLGEALPQIPKAYIRVKEENMTIFIIKKYLVTKLGLSNEAEVDVSCMGLNLLQTQTLKQVRDIVWLPRLIQSVNSTLLFQNSQEMCMPLHYGRPCHFKLN